MLKVILDSIYKESFCNKILSCFVNLLNWHFAIVVSFITKSHLLFVDQIHFHNHLLSAMCLLKLSVTPTLYFRRPCSINALSVACLLNWVLHPPCAFVCWVLKAADLAGKIGYKWEYDGFENDDDSCHHSPLSKKMKEVTKKFPRRDLKQQREIVHQQKPCTRLLPAWRLYTSIGPACFWLLWFVHVCFAW